MAGAFDKTVWTADEILTMIHEGTLYRTTEATRVNKVSLRSHADRSSASLPMSSGREISKRRVSAHASCASR